MWQQWINGILGLFVLVLAFIGLSGTTLTWTLAITGAVVAILGFWGASAHDSSMEHRTRVATR
jgi:hypothetical protein